ncbi:MAG: PIN domain-containing protein [Actinomycetota bacterium]|nr:PIN domain-containing protein [Actinomycetota bacterium]
MVILVRLLSMFLCSYGGSQIAEIVNRHYIRGEPQQILAIILGIILGLLIGYVIGGVAGRAIANLAGRLEAFIARISGADFFFGFIGATAGLLIGLLVSIALFHFGQPGYVLSIVLLVFFGISGMRIGVLKRPELSAMFKLSSYPGRGPAAESAYILDTSVIIDGRILDVAKSGFLKGRLLVPGFVLAELQTIADSSDSLRRNRGKRGLEVLNALKKTEEIEIEVVERDFPEISDVDAKIIALAREENIPIVTNDSNLGRIAELQGLSVLNFNKLTSALQPVVLPGEEIHVKVVKEGKEPGQGVGYLDDGTMVVVERGKEKVGMEVRGTVTSMLQTPAGKMVFMSLDAEAGEH